MYGTFVYIKVRHVSSIEEVVSSPPVCVSRALQRLADYAHQVRPFVFSWALRFAASVKIDRIHCSESGAS